MKPKLVAAQILLAAALAVPPAAGLSAQPHGGHDGHMAPAPKAASHHHESPGRAADASPSTKAYEAANAKMNKDMAIAFTGDADVDFVKGMIPHHQGAIDMAEVVLKYGKDETTKKWAADIIREQKREIGEMEAWLKKNAR